MVAIEFVLELIDIWQNIQIQFHIFTDRKLILNILFGYGFWLYSYFWPQFILNHGHLEYLCAMFFSMIDEMIGGFSWWYDDPGWEVNDGMGNQK